MDKNESLAFLQSCIDSINVATLDEIALLQKAYEINCVAPIVSSDFEFVHPSDLSTYLYERTKVVNMKISKTDCIMNVNEISWNYNLEGISANNEQSNENLSYAA